jgi:hypothetical protein
MSRSQAEVFALMLAHEAAAAALRDELEHRARERHERDGAASTDRLPGGQVVSNLTKSHASVTDQESFLLYLKKRFPGEVVHRMQPVLEARNPSWVKKLLEGYMPVLQQGDDGLDERLEPGDTRGVRDDEGTQVPGVIWVQGGAFRSIGIRADAGLKEVLGEAAGQYAAGTAGLDVLRLEA